ncbi:MAG: hypothetical protein ACRCWD_08810 [Culicoidibacterales bacterium]
MIKNITFEIDETMYDDFKLALELTKESSDAAVNKCIGWYISQAFAGISNKYTPKTNKITKQNDNKDFYAKANRRIPIWAFKPNQYNHKIIRAYFMAMDIAGDVHISMMENLCSEKERMDLFVPTFKSNYAQMKLDGPQTHGKVFEDDGHRVWIWGEIEPVLMKYKRNFYMDEE